MQPGDGYSVPRRALDIEDYIDILRRHKGWIFGPFLLTLVASVVGVYLWPDSYVSQAVVKIVPQQVPQNMVQSSINQLMSDRINSMAQDDPEPQRADHHHQHLRPVQERTERGCRSKT